MAQRQLGSALLHERCRQVRAVLAEGGLDRPDLLGAVDGSTEAGVPRGARRPRDHDHTLGDAERGDLRPAEEGDPVQELADLVTGPRPGDDGNPRGLPRQPANTAAELVERALLALDPLAVVSTRFMPRQRRHGRPDEPPERRSGTLLDRTAAAIRSISSTYGGDTGTSSPCGRTKRSRNRRFRSSESRPRSDSSS